MGGSGWDPPLVDDDWHAIFQAIYKDVEAQDWEVVFLKYVEMHEAINLKKSGGNKKAKALWSRRDAKADGETYYDRDGEQHIENRSVVRQEMRERRI